MATRIYTKVDFVDNNRFSVSEPRFNPNRKPREISALNTLSKIEEVIRLHKRGTGEFATDLSERALSYKLLERADLIRDGYMDKTARIARSWGIFSFLWKFFCRISAKEQAVDAIYNRIKSHFPGHQLPNVVIFQNLARFVDVNQIALLAQVSQQQHRFANESIRLRAQEYGYEGHNRPVEEARNYLKLRFKAVALLAQSGFIPDCCKVYRDEQRTILDRERTLDRIKNCDNETKPVIKEHFNRALLCVITPLSGFRFPGGRNIATERQALDHKIHCYICLSLVLDYGADAQQLLLPANCVSLYLAIGDPEVLKLLLKPRRLDPNAQNRGESLLHLAQSVSRSADILLEKGANPNFLGVGGLSPFHLAIMGRNLEVIRKYLQHGADPNVQTHGPWIICSSLHIAVEGMEAEGGIAFIRTIRPPRRSPHIPNIEVVRLLLENGADPNIQDSRENTPLQLARRHGLTEIAELLLVYGADN